MPVLVVKDRSRSRCVSHGVVSNYLWQQGHHNVHFPYSGLVIPAMENIFSKCKDDSFDMNRISLNNGLQQGDYFIGPKVNFCSHPVKEITECIAKQEGSDECVVFKIVHCVSGEERDHNSQGKVLLHNEHLILSLLQDKQGVIHHRGLFKYLDKYILVLDCVMSHEHDKKGLYKDFINLQQYVIQKKQLQWIEALEVFCSMMTTLKMLHQVRAVVYSYSHRTGMVA